MRKIATGACLAAMFVLSLVAQTKKELDKALSPEGIKQYQEERTRLYQWDSFKFLIGRWNTKAGAINVGFEVTPTLDGKALVITNTEPNLAAAMKAKPSTYESLTYVYVEGLTPRATLFDNHGRMLTYDVQAGPKKLSLVSRGAAVRNRINFEESKDGAVSIAVESAAPGAAKGQFKSEAKIEAVRVSK